MQCAMRKAQGARHKARGKTQKTVGTVEYTMLNCVVVSGFRRYAFGV